jgi:hypothetical protein
MATVLELIDAEIEAFHSNVETGSLDDKSPMRVSRQRGGGNALCPVSNS